MAKSVLVTGAAGFVGGETIKELATLKKKGKVSKIIALDVREVPADSQLRGVTYRQGDILAGDIADILKKNKIDTVVHLASIVTPGKKSNREFEYRVDVDGTRNIFESCIAAGVKKIILTSSGAAYGYHADNPQWLKEDDQIRGNEEFAYCHHKRLVEEMAAEYRRSHPKLKQVIFRPGTILGANVKNQITNLFEKKTILGLRHTDIPFVIIWDRDVVAVIVKAILEKKEGIFNLAGDGVITMKEIAQILGRRYLVLPPTLVKLVLTVLKPLGLSRLWPETGDFLRYRPVLDNQRLKEEFGYTPQFTSKQAFEEYLAKRVVHA